MYIRETIESVINQSYKNYEYIIVDAGSTDGSRDIILEYKDKFSKIIFENDNGPADGLNKGYEYATGDIYCYLNSDDVLITDAFEIAANYFKSTNADVIYGNGYIVDETGKVTGKIISDKISFNKLLHSAVTFNQPSIFHKSEIFRKVGGYNSINTSCWDLEILLDFSYNSKKLIKINDYLSNFRLYKDSITGSNRLSDIKKKNINMMYKKYTNNDIGLSYYIYKAYYKYLKIATNPKKYFEKFKFLITKH